MCRCPESWSRKSSRPSTRQRVARWPCARAPSRRDRSCNGTLTAVAVKCVRLVEDLDEMQDGDVAAALAQPLLDLKDAAGIRGDDRLRARALDVADLAREQACGHL